MAIDADGSPHAYHPVSSKGLDYLGNAGHPGNWWALATYNERPSGEPVIQNPIQSAPGFYVSTTALEIPGFTSIDQRRYINSELVPFIVLPSHIGLGLRLGDLCLCFNTATGDNNYGIYADIGPNGQIGEASIAMAESLKVPSNPRHGGVAGGIIYWVMPGSGKGYQDKEDWFPQANALFQSWGGLKHLSTFTDEP